MYTRGYERCAYVHPVVWEVCTLYTPGGMGGMHPVYTHGYDGCAHSTPVGMTDVPIVHPWVWEVYTLLYTTWV